MKQTARLLSCFGWLVSAMAVCGQVVINEIMYRAPGIPQDVTREWVELYNVSPTNVNLGGWRLTKGVAFSFPAGTIIPARGYLVVAANTTTFETTYPDGPRVIGDWTGALRNSGDTLELDNAQGQVINSVTFATEGDWAKRCAGEVFPGQPGWWRGWGWTNAADGEGSSVELINPALPNAYGQNWAASQVAGGTPGAANSIFNPDLPPMILDVIHIPAVPKATDTVTINARIVDEDVSSDTLVTVFYRNDGQSLFASAPMYDDGAHGDGAANDQVYGAFLPPRPDKTIVEFYVRATDGSGQARTWPGPTDSSGTQGANALYQVDEEVYPGTQPVFRLVATAADRANWFNLMDNVSNGRYSDAEMNATAILTDSTGSDVRYRAGVRNRGAGTRAARPHNLHLAVPNDVTLRKYRALDFNTRTVHSQTAGNTIFNAAGLANAFGAPVQVRLAGVNYANVSPSGGADTFQFGSYYCFETYDADWARRQFPNDGAGNVYKGTWYFDWVGIGVGANLNWLGSDPTPYKQEYSASGPTSSAGPYSKQSNASDDDWSDLINLTYILNQTADEDYTNSVAEVINIDQWFKFIGLNTLLCNEETTLATGAGDDYLTYRGMVDPRFILLAHDFDTVLGQGDSTANYTKSIFDAAIGGGNRPGIPALNRLMKHPLYAPRYFEILKNLCDTTCAPAQINPLLQQALGGWVPSSYIQSMQVAADRRRTNVLNQIPLSLTITHGLAVQSGYPRTTSPTVNLSGVANAIKTRVVLVNGVAASWSAWEARWTRSGVTLQPGINRVLVQSLDGEGAEVERRTLDIWYDTTILSIGGGTLTTNSLWSPTNGIYRLTGSLTIGNGATLTILPGTTVYLDSGVNLSIANGGRLLAEGTPTMPIRFTRVPGSSSSWGGIIVNGAGDSPETRLTYAHLEFNGTTAIHSTGGTVFLDHLTFGATGYQYLSLDSSSFVVSDCVFPAPTASFEPLHGTGGIKSGGRGLFLRNFFGPITGYNDVIDFTGGNRPDSPIVQFVNNVFTGTGDDFLDLDGTDAWVEGNIFLHVHKNGSPDSSSAVSGGNDSGQTSEVTVLGNLFFDCDQAAMAKQGNFFTLLNNTIVHQTRQGGLDTEAGVVCLADEGTAEGSGMYLEGNIIYDAEQLVRNWTAATLTFTNNFMTLPWDGPGGANSPLNPLFKHLPTLSETTNFTSWAQAQVMKDWLSLLPGSPARNAGPTGRDAGGVILAGVAVTGEPFGTTFRTTATLTVGPNRSGNGVPSAGWPDGAGYTHYRWRLNNGSWSAETPIANPIVLNGLTNGQYRVDVIGRRDSGTYQNDPVLGADAVVTSSRLWRVDTNYHHLFINEILAANRTAVAHEETFPDLIELFNDGATPVDLTGLGLTDDPTQPFRFTFPPGLSLGAGEYLVLYADAVDYTSGIHLGFGLQQNGGGVYLYGPSTNRLDSVVYGLQLPDRSIGRLADGSWALTVPTFGGPNLASPVGSSSLLKINEWLAFGQSFFLDDFIEVYNPQPVPVGLGGHYLTDNFTGWPDEFRIAPLSFIEAKSYLPFLADKQPELGADHLNFGLSQTWGQLGLLAPDLTLIDQIYYASQANDGSQGRSPDGTGTIVAFPTPTPGAPNPAALSPFTTNIIVTAINLVKATNFWKYNDSATDLGTSWRAPSYNDASWSNGYAMLYHGNGYGNPPLPVITRSLRFIPGGGTSQPTFYFRTRFNLTTNPADASLTVSHYIDDGAVVYINGQEAYRFNMNSGTISYGTWCPNTVSGDAGLIGPIIIPRTNLVQGTNVIAVEVHQQSASSSDLTFALSLDLTKWTTNITGNATVVLNEVMANNQSVTNADGSITDWVELYNPSDTDSSLADLSLSDDSSTPRRWVFPPDATIPARGYLVVRCDGNAPASTNSLGALNTGFGLKASGSKVYLFDARSNGGGLLDSIVFGLQAPDYSLGRIPNATGAWALCLPTLASANVAAGLGNPMALKINEWMADPASGSDWFELYNPGNQPVSMGGYYLTQDLNNRTKYLIPPYSFIASGGKGFALFQADNKPSSGADHVNFRLAKEGSPLGLFAPNGTLVDGVTFGAQATGVSEGRLPDGNSTIVRFPTSSTPGNANYLPLTTVAINEVLSHTDDPLEDAIEVRNLTPQALDIGGWWLSDARDDLKRFRIPDGTVLSAGGYAVFYEYQINPYPWHAPAFALNGAKGDQIFLAQTDGQGNLTGYHAEIAFGAAENGVSFGRYESSVDVDFVALSQRTFGVDAPASTNDFVLGQGLPNAYPKVGPLVFNEIMYHPPDVGTNDNSIDEYLELLNVTDRPVPLFNLDAPQFTWHLRDGVDFDFPTNITVPAHGLILVVNFNPTNSDQLAAFRLKYGVSDTLPVFGPYQGKLANDSEGLNLNKPDQLEPNGDMPYVLVERVVYADSAPWPSLADGNTNYPAGVSLQRRVATEYGNDPVNWFAGLPTAGRANGTPLGNAPTILTQPVGSFVAAGANVTLNVAASGDPVLTVQWRFNGHDLPGATNASLLITNVRSANSGAYTVRISNPAGSVLSTPAVVAVSSAPVIAQQPLATPAALGGSAVLRVAATGTLPLAYQWWKGAALLPGATGSTLVFPTVHMADAGNYQVVITNVFGAVTSSVAALYISSPPVITNQPQAVAAFVGDTVTFTVGAEGSLPLRYQWRWNGNPLLGATNPSLLLPAVSVGQAGLYSVVVSNAVGYAFSANAGLTVVVPAIVSVFASAPVAAETGPASGAFTLTRNGDTSLALPINFAVTGTAANGSDYQTLTSPVTIPPGASSVVIPVVPIDDSVAEPVETVVLTLTSGAAYIVEGAPATVSIIDNDNLAPVVSLTAPANDTFLPVSPTNVLLVAQATDPDGSVAAVRFFYQQTNLIGQVAAPPYQFVWTNALPGSNLLTAVAVDNFGLATVSRPVVLWVNAAPAVALTSPTNGNSFPGPANILVSALVSDVADAVTQVDLYQDGALLTSLAQSPYSFVASNLPYGTYQFMAVATDSHGLMGTSAVATVAVKPPIPFFADMFAERGIAMSNVFSVTGTNVEATKELDEPLIWEFNGGGRSLWLSWIASSAGGVTIDTLSSTFDTLLSVYTNAPGQPSALANLVKVAENDDAPGLRVLQSQVQFTNLIPGQEYLITVDGYNGANGIVNLHVALTSFAPTIATQPVSQTNNLGSNVTFTVAATGPGTLRYQWHLNGTNLPGRTGASLVLSNLSAADTGSYDVLVTSEFGSTPSAAAFLLVRTLPSIVVQPQSRSVLVGSAVTLSVGATGGGLTYQWRYNGANINGATGSSYTLGNIREGQAGAYSVLVSNVLGTVLSQPANLTVLASLDRPILASPAPTNGLFKFSISGNSANYKCYVHVSTNLVSWKTVTILTNLNGTLSVTDTNPATGYRFYRAYLAP